MDRETELDAFKTDIPLAQFAAGEFGYVLDRKRTSPHSVYMRNPATGSQISIFRNATTHAWIYKSYTDHGDKGTVLDMVQRRTGENIGQVRRRLRPWLNGPSMATHPIPAEVPREVKPTRSDVIEIRSQFENDVRLIKDGHHAYLNQVRGLPAADLAALPLANSVHTDRRGNALFVHRDKAGITGWESRNHDWKSFSKLGYKSLWYATPGLGEVETLVWAESAIDAISYALLHPDPHACYLSTSGQISLDHQAELIRSAMNKLCNAGRIIIAADNDQPGDSFAQTFADLLQQTGRTDLHFKKHSPAPAKGIKDWNDELRANFKPPCPEPAT